MSIFTSNITCLLILDVDNVLLEKTQCVLPELQQLPQQPLKNKMYFIIIIRYNKKYKYFGFNSYQ